MHQCLSNIHSLHLHHITLDRKKIPQISDEFKSKSCRCCCKTDYKLSECGIKKITNLHSGDISLIKTLYHHRKLFIPDLLILRHMSPSGYSHSLSD